MKKSQSNKSLAIKEALKAANHWVVDDTRGFIKKAETIRRRV